MHVIRELRRPAALGRSVAGGMLALALALGGSVASPAPVGEIPPALPVAATPYYVAAAGEARGPLSLEVILSEIESGRLSAWTLVWKPGLSGWIRAGDLPELGEALAAAGTRSDLGRLARPQEAPRACRAI